MADNAQVAHEVEMLKDVIRRLGTTLEDGSVNVTFGRLFDDDECQQMVRVRLRKCW
jgi:hypothetical protein